MKIVTVIAVLVYAFETAQGQVIGDPVADFLTLPIADRYSDASVLSRVDKVSIDLDLDGNAELLVGHHKMWLGDNESVYYAVYRKLPDGGYKRLTKPSEDVAIIFRDGRSEYNFVGRVDELDDIGLLVCNPLQGDADFRTQIVESRIFVSIAGDVVRVRELPGLDLSKEADLAFYKKYFPLPGKQGGFEAESLKPDALKDLGLVLPDWTKPERFEASESPANQAAPEISSSSPVVPAAPKEEPKAKSAPAAISERLASSTSWTIVAIGVAAVLGLLWVLLKNRK